MIDTFCILLSLVSVFWIAVRAAMLDPLRPWVERLAPRRDVRASTWPPPS